MNKSVFRSAALVVFGFGACGVLLGASSAKAESRATHVTTTEPECSTLCQACSAELEAFEECADAARTPSGKVPQGQLGKCAEPLFACLEANEEEPD